MNDKSNNPLDTIHKQDKEKQIQEETKILADANGIADGTSKDEKALGRIVLWQVKESIEHNTLLRHLIEYLENYQLKIICDQRHKPKCWPLKLWGITYQSPVSVTIIVLAFFVFMFCRKEGWL